MVLGDDISAAVITASKKVGRASDIVTTAVLNSERLVSVKSVAGFTIATGAAYVVAHPEVAVQFYHSSADFIAQY